MKKKVGIAVFFGFVIVLLFTVALADTTLDCYEYTVSDGKVTITDYFGDESSLNVPEKIAGFPVTAVADKAFGYNTSLISVTFPDNIVTIGKEAFIQCSSLKSVSLPSGLDVIPYCLFLYCDSLESVTIPDSVTTIGMSAFDGTPILSIDLPSNLSSIGLFAFASCNNLKSITIPSKCSSIDPSAFDYCANLSAINVAPGNNNYISQNGVLYNNDKSTLLIYPSGKSGSFTVPDNVTKLGEYAFMSSHISDITISKNVRNIGDHCFTDCFQLKNINVSSANNVFSSVDGLLYNKAKTAILAYPNGRTNTSFSIPISTEVIGSLAFESNYLHTVSIPNGVKEINDEAFYASNGLKSISIPNGVTHVGDRAFEFCGNLESVVLPNTIQVISEALFGECDSLQNITIPESVKMIKDWAFAGCDNLTKAVIPSSVTSIEKSSFENCGKLTIYGEPDSYAETYAKNNNIPFISAEAGKLSITSVKANKSSVDVGTAITWKVTADGGDGTKTYRFLLYKDGELLTSSKFTTAATYKYTPKDAGTYKVRAYVKDSTGTVSMNSANVIVKGPLSITSVKANKTSVAVGTAITWKTTAAGGSGTKTYRFLLYKDGKLLVSGKYGTSGTYKYTPKDAGTYKLRAYVKDSTGSVSMNSANVIVKAPLSITSVKANKTSVAVGTAITWTASAAGGSGTKTYRFLLYKDGKLFLSGKFGSARTYRYIPTKAGTYKVRVYVKDSTATISKNSESTKVK